MLWNIQKVRKKLKSNSKQKSTRSLKRQLEDLKRIKRGNRKRSVKEKPNKILERKCPL
jgi:hypothetical protein